jgi:MbtH protein
MPAAERPPTMKAAMRPPTKRGALVSNPFEDADGHYRVLTNDEAQYSLWPAALAVPDGWAAVHDGSRSGCLDYVEEHWTDLRPASLVRAEHG